MDILLNIFGLFGLFLLIIWVLALIKPKVILGWNKKPKRWKVLIYGILVMIVYLIFFGLLHQSVESKKTPTEIISLSGKDIENGKYDTAIERLNRIEQQDVLYMAAQQLVYKAERLIKEKIINSSIEDIDKGKYDKAIERLGKIVPEDSLYTFVQTLITKAKLFSELKKTNLTILTIKDIPLSDGRMATLKFKLVDEEYNEVEMPVVNANSWFENIHLVNITVPKETPISALTPGHLSVLGKVVFEFVHNGTDYTMNVGIGSPFVVSKTDKGTYNLFPEETIRYTSILSENK